MTSFKHFVIFLCMILSFSFFVNRSFAISIPEENEVAKKFMDMIEKKQMVLKDPIASHLVNQVGRHILSFLPPQPFDYSFYIVDDDVFNAFAGPGAHIFAYRGLITSLDSVDELAGIIGHEIAHAASRHVSESIDRSRFINIGSLAGMLAGAIIGGSAGGKAGVTIAQGSMAIGQTAMLAFTRENETEADEKGIMFLKKSCFSPQGLLSGLMKIRASDYRGVEGIPDYVKTHPGTGNRIAHTETILSGYTPSPDKAICTEDFRFNMVKYRLLGLYGDIEPAFKRLNTLLDAGPSIADAAALHYGLGLVYARKSRRDEALVHLRKALTINVFDPMVLVEMGRVYLLGGDPEKALNVLRGLDADPVVGIMAQFHQATAYLELRELSKAKDLFNAVIDKTPSLYPNAYYSMANIMSLEKKQGLSHYYLGLYYAETRNNKTALLHLKKALENSDEVDIEKTKKLIDQLKKKSEEDNKKQ